MAGRIDLSFAGDDRDDRLLRQMETLWQAMLERFDELRREAHEHVLLTGGWPPFEE
jgi:hypothetical protein